MARFTEVRGSFWKSSTPGPSATAESIAQAQEELGVPLPTELVELLEIQNGGAVAEPWTAFPTTAPNSWADDHVRFDWLMGTAPTPLDSTTLHDSPYLCDEWGLPGGLVLLSGDGDDFIALDYRHRPPQVHPSVTWFDTDDQSEIPLAPSFRDFIEGLVAESRFNVGE